MIEPWFSPGVSRWLTFLSLFSLTSVLGYYVRQGRFRMPVTLTLRLCAGIGLALLASSLFGTWLGQPRYVIFPLAVSGSVMSVVFVSVLWMLPRQYTKAEMRRIAASDL